MGEEESWVPREAGRHPHVLFSFRLFTVLHAFECIPCAWQKTKSSSYFYSIVGRDPEYGETRAQTCAF